jgi:NAD(P)-dependent dehydrogenase (short-subunit alcohol dehydrogenase family)
LDQGKIALVTGGNSGIGLATAKQFVNEGAYVFITGRRDPELAAAVKEIGRNVTDVQGDVSNLGDLDRLFAQIKREKGKLDIVFANAGVARFAPFGTITEDFYDSIFNINVKGLLFTVRSVQPMRSRRPWCFSHPTTAATSRERSCLWMVVSHKCRPLVAGARHDD